MVDLIALAAGSGLLLAAAGLLAALLRLESAVAFALATFLFAWAIAVGFILGLSPFHEVRPATTWGWLLGVFAIALTCWRRGGRPVPPLQAFRASARVALSDAKVRVLAVFAAIGCVYITALAVATPESESDALTYHIARAAFWHQDRAVGYIGNAIETRLNVNPPNAEIGDLFTMLASGTQRYVGLVQVGALVACMLATVGIARRIGAGPAPAMWAGSLVVTFPVIATQAPTAQNDLVVAAFLAVSAFFLLGRNRAEHTLAGLALALAVGTKFTGVLSVPLLLVVLAAAPGGKRLARAAWLLGIGAVGGCVWYLVNFSQTHHLDGGLAKTAAQRPASIHIVAQTLDRFFFNSFDLSGVQSGGLTLNSVVGVGVLLLGLGSAILAKGRNATAWWLVAIGLVIGAAPDLVTGAYHLFSLVPHVSHLASDPNTRAAATQSWFGPLGVIGVVTGVIVAARAARRRGVPRVALVLALAPVILIVTFAFTIVWDPWRGRFVIAAFVLTGAAWSLMLPYRWLAWGVTGIACLTLATVLLNDETKPSGVTLFDSAPQSGIWSKPDWWAQSLYFSPGSAVVLRYAAQRMPADASLAVALQRDDLISPYFDPNLTRHVTLALNGHHVSHDANWLILAPRVRPAVCSRDWRVMVSTADGWIVAKRLRTSVGCPVGSA